MKTVGKRAMPPGAVFRKITHWGGRGEKMCVVHLDVIGRVCQFYYYWTLEIHLVTILHICIKLGVSRKEFAAESFLYISVVLHIMCQVKMVSNHTLIN